MKKRLVALFVGLSVLPLVGQAQVNTVTIMPMGDSVTARGSSPESSYRYWLWKDLQDAGFHNFMFVGNQNGVSDGTPANSWPEESYEGGYPAGPDAWTTQDGVNAAPSAASTTPDFLILDLGSNDIINGIDPATTQANLETIIQDFISAKPNVIILLARPTPFAVDPIATTQEKQQERRQESQLATMAVKVARAEKHVAHVIVVNQFGGFNIKTDTKDGTHPNVRGEQKIARKYFSVLKKYMRRM